VTALEHDLTTFDCELNNVTTYVSNPRRGDVAAIAESLAANGQVQPIVVNRGTFTGRPFEVLSGNHTVMAARSLGWQTLSAVLIDVDDDAARRVVLSMNRTHDLGTYDLRSLADILRNVSSPVGTGYDAAAISRILAAPIPTVGDYSAPRGESAPLPPTQPRNDPAAEWEGREPAGGIIGFSARPMRVLTVQFWTELAVQQFEDHIGQSIAASTVIVNLPNKTGLEALQS